MTALPDRGVPAEQVLAELGALRGRDLPTHGGRLFAYVYDAAVPGLDQLTASAYALAAHVNGLDPTAFPSLLAMENDLVAAAAQVTSGAEAAAGVVGNVTSGGTESLLLAVKAARDAHPDLATPRLVVPASAHAAFAKAAQYLRVALDVVEIDPATLLPDPAAMAAAITADTVLVACSAPAYPYGVIDPVAEIAAVAADAGVRCHVDACFGGWLLPYLRRLGRPIPPFGFELPGVTSVSVDLHKYAYAPKGVSVLLHRDASLRRPQYFGFAGWPGYPLLNATVASTRSGGPVAGAWATLRHLGDDGYLRLAERTWSAVTGLAAAVSTVDGLRLLAEPQTSVVVFTCTDPDPYVLADQLAARGWHTQPQLPYPPLPASIHLSVTAAVADQVAEFGPALHDAVAAARAAPIQVPPELAAAVADLDPATLGPETMAGLAAAAGFGPDGLPESMAIVNTLLATLPPERRAALLVEFLSLLQTPAHRPA
ncbi:pyridoxal phosphate-dependent decarboxylase family protein [Actinocatenispora sera]|uniref:Aspartate aminotransferase family protein n=1 Tax=Actinocatenispora sera TaxID=390989 RepID=A0A810L0Y0_9ACTN|nr:aminotransferase class V-fold PLP-dependent enzyme [Actinocatenispora sera]BCJ28857.1 aspartate aminotransferase family protein [Actinocatenispora sera]